MKYRKRGFNSLLAHMAVNINAQIVHEADSKIEAEAWIASHGHNFPNKKLQIVRNRQKFVVKAK